MANIVCINNNVNHSENSEQRLKCNLNLSESDIRLLIEQALYERGFTATLADMGVTFDRNDGKLSIIESVPIPLEKIESDYELAKYEAVLTLDEVQFKAWIDACAKIFIMTIK